VVKYLCIFMLLCISATATKAYAFCATGSLQPLVLPAGYGLIKADYTPACNQTDPGDFFTIFGYATGDNEALTLDFASYPVGYQLGLCAVSPIPSGWTQTGTSPNASCAGVPGGGDRVVVHTTCEPTDTNCYPPNPTISFSPNPVVVPYGETSTTITINWTMGESNPTCVWYQMDDFTHHSPYPSQCGGTSGTATYSVQVAHQYKFWIGNQAGDTTVWKETPIFSVTQGPQPMFSATPNPVVIPAGKTTAGYTLSWNAPYYAQVSIYAVQNLNYPGELFCLGNTSGTGSAAENVQIGEVATLYLTAYNGCTAGTVVSSPPPSILKTISLTTMQGAAATINASPNPVTIPSGQTSAPYTLSWNAPGYSQVSIYASNNLIGSQIYCLGSSAATGSAGEHMSTGEIAEIYLTTYSACTAGTVATPPAPYLATLHLTTN
jgi:hypothetical protein